MASSPTSSSASSRSTPFASPDFSSLPIMALREKIVEKILENRVTLIVGETGCGIVLSSLFLYAHKLCPRKQAPSPPMLDSGAVVLAETPPDDRKSSQVPQFLLDKNIKPILCTQPRRFAVVAVAKMVAKARNCELGSEVGYHIGHSKHFSSSSKIVFKTAGVLLDEMRDRGQNALEYKAIILDEVHERSVESDLVLVCVKQFLLKNKNMRLVLMSATADITRYREYFGDIGRDERVEVLAIPSSNQQTIFQRRVLYLDRVTKLLERDSDSPSAEYCSGEEPTTANPNIKPEVHSLIHDLVLWIHANEPDIEKSILVFLPTYRSLVQQWFLLRPLSSLFKVHILHSSIDTDQALRAMRISKSHRKIILATNIAESSVTIPKVAFVIDSCRSLQVYWDSNRKAESSELAWISKSQAEQRKGRTGRTCDGQVYRLVTGSFFNKLKDHECPTILRLSLRQQVLHMCCAESKAINDPKVLLQKALDPPEPDIVEDALDMLIHIGALEKTSHRGRYEPTFFGRLLASFSLSFDASMLILKFGVADMLHEGILLGILMDIQPLPILQPFGEEHLFEEYMGRYFIGDNSCDKTLGQKEMDNLRLEHLKEVLKYDAAGVTQETSLKIEEMWCVCHNLVQSSLNHVSEIYEDVLCTLHQFRPDFLPASDGIPSYYYPYEFQHECLLQDAVDAESDDEQLHQSSDVKQCVAGPFVSLDHFQTKYIADKMATVIKEIRALYTGALPGSQPTISNGTSVYAQAPGCRNGDSCHFSHDTAQLSSSTRPSPCLPEEDIAKPQLLIELFPPPGEGNILILDDTNFQFTSNIACFWNPEKMFVTTSLSESYVSEPSLEDVRISWALHHPYQTLICEPPENSFSWRDIRCVLWFPDLDNQDKNLERQAGYVRSFFEFMAIRLLAESLHSVQVVVTMKNIRFSQLQVEKLGRNSFFFLRESFLFDEQSFGEVLDGMTTRRPMVVSKAVSYVFVLHPPSSIQFGDYQTEIRRSLQDAQ
ncbi:hypothetical protein CDL15_Pgr019500 [Punica granatum]|uniref:RNA helicase n=1 Tax=Punica granatum TaxID=22663 RepID=A0A218VU11_PUNGR|nr:hypothetical protein CDL15_Pgr019500 [Punica granatum]